jgi:hypothetical protein
MKAGPSGSAIRPLIKQPQAAAAKIRGGERCGKVGTMIPAGMVERGERKRTAAEVSKAD